MDWYLLIIIKRGKGIYIIPGIAKVFEIQADESKTSNSACALVDPKIAAAKQYHYYIRIISRVS